MNRNSALALVCVALTAVAGCATFTPHPVLDSDRDGVPDARDLCPGTPSGEAADAGGCSASQRDGDGDGVPDSRDLCPSTPSGEAADAGGCSASQRDGDGDGVPDSRDLCPGTPSGEAADAGGCSASQRDGDGDGVPDSRDLCPGFDDRLDGDGDGRPDGCDITVLIDGLGSVSEAADDRLTAVPAEGWRFAGWVKQGELQPEGALVHLGETVVARFRFAWPEGVGALDAWLEAHGSVAQALIWQAPGGCEKGCVWPWPAAAQDELFRAFARAWAGEPSGLCDPPPNVADVSDPERFTRQALAGGDARALFAAYAAGSLCSEIKGDFPWSILEYKQADIRVLLDSREFWTLRQSSTDAGPAGSYQISSAMVGQSLPATPERARRFLDEEGILAGSRLATIGGMLEWFTCGSPGCDSSSSSAGAIHFLSHWYNWNAWSHWQYVGYVPAIRLMDGTPRLADEAHGARADARIMHRTAGCWGTVGFLRSVLRAANIPVVLEKCSAHACVGFPTENLHLSHGDDPYNMFVKKAFLRDDALRNVPAIDVACREAGGGDGCDDLVFGDALWAAWFLPPPGAPTADPLDPTQEQIEEAFFEDISCGDLEGQSACPPEPEADSNGEWSAKLNVGRRPREEHAVRWLSGHLLDQRCREMGLGADAVTNMGLRDWTPDELRSHPLGNLYERLDARNRETRHCGD